MRNSSSRRIASVVVAILSLASTATASTLLDDVDFTSETVGAAPAAVPGAPYPRTHATQPFGDLVVVDSAGALDDQPLRITIPPHATQTSLKQLVLLAWRREPRSSALSRSTMRL